MSALLEETRLDDAQRLMNDVLRGGATIAPEYPLVFDADFAGRVVSVQEEHQVRSACGVLARDFLVAGTRLRGGMIGSVATDPEHRRRGLATRLLEEAEASLRAEGCAFALLWADEPDFYYRRGYGPVGVEHDFVLPFALAARLPLATGVRALRPEDVPALHALYERHRVRLGRSLEEMRALLDCPGMSTLVRERAGEPVAYACLGRGVDLENAVHEWGGAVDDLLPLLRAHLERLAGSSASPQLYLMAPSSARELTLRLEALGALLSRSMLGLGKVWDRTAAAEALTEILAPHGTVRAAQHDGGDTFWVQGPRDEGGLDDEGALAVLMGVGEVRQHVASFLARFGLESARLPLEPFVWGLDSI